MNIREQVGLHEENGSLHPSLILNNQQLYVHLQYSMALATFQQN
jgi:hypothetical protein